VRVVGSLTTATCPTDNKFWARAREWKRGTFFLFGITGILLLPLIEIRDSPINKQLELIDVGARFFAQI